MFDGQYLPVPDSGVTPVKRALSAGLNYAPEPASGGFSGALFQLAGESTQFSMRFTGAPLVGHQPDPKPSPDWNSIPCSCFQASTLSPARPKALPPHVSTQLSSLSACVHRLSVVAPQLLRRDIADCGVPWLWVCGLSCVSMGGISIQQAISMEPNK